MFDQMTKQYPLAPEFNQNQENQENQEPTMGGKRRRKSSKKLRKGGVGMEAIVVTGALVLGNEIYKRRSSRMMGKSEYKGRRSNRRRRSTRRR
jgi:hypothetical protein